MRPAGAGQARRPWAAGHPERRLAGRRQVVQPVEQMPHPALLRPEVDQVLRVRDDLQRLAPDDLQAVPLQAAVLRRVVGEQAQPAGPEVDEDLRADAVLAAVDRHAQVEVRVDGVAAGVLQAVGAQLVTEADAPALVTAEVDDRAPADGGDAGHRRLQLRSAVAAQRAEDVAGQALAVHAHQQLVPGRDVAEREGHVLGPVEDRPVADAPELAPGVGTRASPVRSTRTSTRRRYRIRSAIVITGSPCSAANRSRSGRRAIVPSSLTISQITPAGVSPASRVRSTAASVWPARLSTPPSRARSGKTCPGRLKAAPSSRASASPRMVAARSAAEIPVVVPEARSTVGERGPLLLGVAVADHQRQVQRVAALAGQRHAHDARGVAHHEGDVGRRDVLGGHHEVALVLAVLVVDDDDHPAVGDLLQRQLDGVERSPEAAGWLHPAGDPLGASGSRLPCPPAATWRARRRSPARRRGSVGSPVLLGRRRARRRRQGRRFRHLVERGLDVLHEELELPPPSRPAAAPSGRSARRTRPAAAATAPRTGHAPVRACPRPTGPS